jgi:GNAT superfamily N-acetyltransferase
MTDPLIKLRDHQPTDLAFIYSTWLKGYYHGNEWFEKNHIDEESYHKIYHQVLEKILFKSNPTIKVAALSEDQDVVIGYSITSNNGTLLHWVWVRPVWRNLGIARRLIPSNVMEVSHLTKLARSLKPKNWEYRPFLF